MTGFARGPVISDRPGANQRPPRTAQLRAKSHPGSLRTAQEPPKSAEKAPGAAKKPPGGPGRAPGTGPRAPKGPGEADSPREVRRGPGPAQERPKSHPERPQRLTGAAQDGPGTSLERSTRRRPGGSDGLAEVFKRNVKPTRGFREVDAPKTRNFQGFSHRASIIVELSRRPCRGSRAAERSFATAAGQMCIGQCPLNYRISAATDERSRSTNS